MQAACSSDGSCSMARLVAAQAKPANDPLEAILYATSVGARAPNSWIICTAHFATSSSFSGAGLYLPALRECSLLFMGFSAKLQHQHITAEKTIIMGYFVPAGMVEPSGARCLPWSMTLCAVFGRQMQRLTTLQIFLSSFHYLFHYPNISPMYTL